MVIHVDADVLTEAAQPPPSPYDAWAAGAGGEAEPTDDGPAAVDPPRSGDGSASGGMWPSRAGRCQLEDGPALAAETVRRLACDSGIVFMLDGADGVPVNVSRRSPSISAALARAVKARDGGCRFPGCTHRRFVDVHHIVHRAHGGDTTLANLLELCRAHHRLVHEGGYRIETTAPGHHAFYRPDGSLLDTPTIAVEAGDDAIRAANANRGIHPTPDTPIPSWAGERPDYAYIVDILLTPTPDDTFPRERVNAAEPST